jgi:Cu/Ag efflux protein CusF
MQHRIGRGPRAASATMLAVAVVGLAVALAPLACHRGASTRHGSSTGKVVAVDPAAGEITLDHHEIPGIMGGMTMDFPVSDPALLRGIQPGQEVAFEVESTPAGVRVTSIRPLDGETKPGGGG